MDGRRRRANKRVSKEPHRRIASVRHGLSQGASPVDLGAFANVGAPAGTEWTGNSEPGLADGIQLVALKPLSSNWYYLDASGLTWRQVAGNVASTNTAFAGPTDAMILRRNNPDPDYIILLPFDP